MDAPLAPVAKRGSVGLCLAVAAVTQVAVLAPAQWLWPALFGAAVLGVAIGWGWKRGRSPTLDMLLVTATLGGAAMLAGSLIDLERQPASPAPTQLNQPGEAPPSAALPPCHAAAAEAAHADDPEAAPTSAEPSERAWLELLGAELCSWMTGLMLLVCVPACAWLCEPCRAHRGSRRWLLGHALCTLTMLVGMFAGGMLLGPHVFAIGAEIGLGLLGSAHLSMLLGMLAGVAVGGLALSVLEPRHHHPRIES